MSCNCNSNSNRCASYFTNLATAARQNHKEKYTVVQGDYLKVNVICVPMCGEIGVEVHRDEDQLITVVCGTATVKLGNTRATADCIRRLNAGDSVLIPAGTWHNVCNTGGGQLKLISVYGYGNANGGCGCMQTTGAQSVNCTHAFKADNYDWNTTQTQDNGCSCAIDSGC